MAEAVIETDGLTMEFSGYRVLDSIDLRIERGSVHALIGPNGAGKTTCFNLLTRFLNPTAGRIRYNGRDITRLKPQAVARRGMVRSFQVSAVFPDQSALENVCVALQSRFRRAGNFWRSEAVLRDLEEQAMSLLEEVGLAEFSGHRAALLPYGRKRALELATTLALDPKVLLLDEPTAGMTPTDVDRVTALIARIRQGRTVLMVEHNLSVVSSLCDRVTLLARGRILAEGDYRSIAENPAAKEAYLGSDHA